ncbi:MAG: hypothetical protein ISS31_04715 [Kiritimatiellae bacterium]|nr:hypothetical protein [Kiritimatiellia bacterium]
MSKQERDAAQQNVDGDADSVPILELAKEINRLHERARDEYQPTVNDIIRSSRRDVHEIERTLDGLLGFTGSDACLPLFRRLCRYYWDIDPVATAEYVLAYREMWDSEE